MMAFGWASFDQEVVERIVRRDPLAVDTSLNGFMVCPLDGHADERLSWKDRKAQKGTDWHGEPALRFHASPTYALHERLDNFIAGHRLIQEGLDGEWDKAETHRLGNENSEDALTWNVFRSLQEAGELEPAVRVLGGFEPAVAPQLYLWGRQIGRDTTSKWERLASARDEIEPCGGQQTEPDCCIHIPGQAWLFIEAKFGSPTATTRDAAHRNAWLDRYSKTCPGLFSREAISQMPPREFPEQLLRNVALALRVRASDERVIVIALMRASDRTPADSRARQCLNHGEHVEVRRATWEAIYASLLDQPSLATLRRYFENKSYRLRRAFALPFGRDR